MIYFHDTTDFRLDSPSAVTLGKFDGVHAGHLKLMKNIESHRADGLKSAVFALNSRSEELLLTPEEQKNYLESIGIDALVQCPFVPEISSMTPEEFVSDILVGRLKAKHIAVGTDFRFGCKRAGDASFLKSCESRYDLTVDIIEKEMFHGIEVSSTYIRQALTEGNMELVKTLLGRPFPVEGTVEHGRQVGRTIGMPTANLIPEGIKLLPPDGVYTSLTIIDGEAYPGVTNIGFKPTVGEKFRGVETYLFDVSLDLYGKHIQTQLCHYQRREIRFDSLESLRKQIQNDILCGREYFS